ncbi:zinc finger, C6HC-type containing protein [Tanacetum coccineum]
MRKKFGEEVWIKEVGEKRSSGSEKFYCLFKDCSALLVDDGGEAVTSSECPHCNRLFCAQCKVSWHSGMDCKEYQSLIKKGEISLSDNMLMDLAKNKKWKRCPNCTFYVEKTTGYNKKGVLGRANEAWGPQLFNKTGKSTK